MQVPMLFLPPLVSLPFLLPHYLRVHAQGRVRHGKDLLKYCFSAAYIVVFLHNGLGVGREERRVHFTNSVTDLQAKPLPPSPPPSSPSLASSFHLPLVIPHVLLLFRDSLL